MKELSPQIQNIAEIIGIIITTICLIALITFLIFALIQIFETDKLRQKYIKNLNEHDKAVILDYKTTEFHFFKKHENKRTKNPNQ